MITLDEATPYMDHGRLSLFCNKATALYVAPSGQRYDYLPFKVFSCILKDWFRHYNNETIYEFGRLFADLVHITSNGPQAVAEIVRSHKILCSQASQFITSLDQGQVLSPGLN